MSWTFAILIPRSVDADDDARLKRFARRTVHVVQPLGGNGDAKPYVRQRYAIGRAEQTGHGRSNHRARPRCTAT